MTAKRYWVGCSDANRLDAGEPVGPQTQRDLILKHRTALETAHRLLLAASGRCPECLGEMTVDPECRVTAPPHGEADARVVPAALCNHCECCIEL